MSIKTSNTLKAHLALLLVNLIYGASHIIAKGIMPSYITPAPFILLRVLGATVLFWLISLIQPIEKLDRKDYFYFAVLGLFGVAINQLCFFYGLNLSNSINSGIIMTINPILVSVLSFFFLKEKLSFKNWFGIFIGCLGAVLLISYGQKINTDGLTGDLLLVINATSYAIYLILSKPMMKKYKPLTVITYVFSFGLFWVLLFPPATLGIFNVDFSAFTPIITLQVIMIIVVMTFLTYLLTMYALKYLKASVSSSYIYLQPIFVILFSIMMAYAFGNSNFYQYFTIEKLIFMLLIFLGVYLTNKSK